MPANLNPKTDAEIVGQIDERIEEIRKGNATLQLRDPEDNPIPADVPVDIEMVRHDFLFGCNTFTWGECDTPEDEQIYRERFAALFNYATLHFYWWIHGYRRHNHDPYELYTDVTNEKQRRKIVEWGKGHGIVCKGHALVYGPHGITPPWLKHFTPEEQEQRLWQRIEREVKAFSHAIPYWDVVNEAVWGTGEVIASVYQKYGKPEAIRKAFQLARDADPEATLLINEAGNVAKDGNEYHDLIQSCLEAGASIDVIGLQCHQVDEYWGQVGNWRFIDAYRAYDLPIHMTELSLPSGDDRKNCSGFLGENTRYWPTCPDGEERQRQEIQEVYRLYFSHPAVAAITWWDLSDQGSYADGELPMGLLRRDMSPKPAYDELMQLVKGEWWTTTSESVRSDGTIPFRGFYGTYRVYAQVGSEVYAGQFEMPHKYGPYQTLEVQLTKS